MTTPQAFLVKPDGYVEPVAPRFGAKAFSLDEVQEYVGGYVQLITVNKNLVLLCNEDGGAQNLPENPEAARTLHKESGLDYGFIVGTVVICHPRMFRKSGTAGRTTSRSSASVSGPLWALYHTFEGFGRDPATVMPM